MRLLGPGIEERDVYQQATAADRARQHEPDWAALDALTDEEIDAQIAANPDAARDISDWSLDDPTVSIIVPIDVKAIRTRFGPSQEKFVVGRKFL